MKITFKPANFIVLLIILLAIQIGCKQSDNTPSELKAFKELMISQPSEDKDSITHLLSQFFTDFIPESSNPKNFKYYSKLNGNNFILLVDIPWINSQPRKDQEAVMRVVPMVLDLNEQLKNKKVFVGIYGKQGISIIKTPEGEYYGDEAKQEMLIQYFKD